MLMKILKAFPYSHDGLTTRDLAADAVEDIRDDLVLGLMEEGYVGEPEDCPTAAGDVGQAADASPGPDEGQPEAAEPDEAAPALEVVTSNLSPEAVVAVTTQPNPFDHDGDGKPGGSLPKAKRRSPKA